MWGGLTTFIPDLLTAYNDPRVSSPERGAWLFAGECFGLRWDCATIFLPKALIFVLEGIIFILKGWVAIGGLNGIELLKDFRPRELLLSVEILHDTPYPGDGGYLFTPKDVERICANEAVA